jgi:ABC-type multidrug transport system fused ATPase/permease subunit
MSDVAIHVDRLSKRYNIGGAQPQYKTLRESLVNMAMNPIRRVRGLPIQASSGTLWALKDVSFDVERGEVVGIIGHNGAGKSTLMDLLLRFYDPAAGCITAGGLDLMDWDLRAWRMAVGVVSQDVFLFHATIAENIAYGRLEAGREEIEMAARESGAEHLIRRLPNGLDTVVGERGAKLSGGERQLVALARLFLRNPRVIIMDEPTTHLDGEALQLARTALSRLMVGRTTFLVVHGNEMIPLVDRVLLLDRGQLVADGTDGELSSHNVLYRKLLQEIGESHANQCA